MATVTKLPSGAYRVQIRGKGRYASETFLRRNNAHRWARQAETRVEQGLAPTRMSVSRLRTFGRPHRPSYSRYVEVGKPPRRSKAATLTALTRDLGKEKIGHLDRKKLIDYGKMRAELGEARLADRSSGSIRAPNGPVTLGIDISVIKRIITDAPVLADAEDAGGDA